MLEIEPLPVDLRSKVAEGHARKIKDEFIKNRGLHFKPKKSRKVGLQPKLATERMALVTPIVPEPSPSSSLHENSKAFFVPFSSQYLSFTARETFSSFKIYSVKILSDITNSFNFTAEVLHPGIPGWDSSKSFRAPEGCFYPAFIDVDPSYLDMINNEIQIKEATLARKLLEILGQPGDVTKRGTCVQFSEKGIIFPTQVSDFKDSKGRKLFLLNRPYEVRLEPRFDNKQRVHWTYKKKCSVDDPSQAEEQTVTCDVDASCVLYNFTNEINTQVKELVASFDNDIKEILASAFTHPTTFVPDPIPEPDAPPDEPETEEVEVIVEDTWVGPDETIDGPDDPMDDGDDPHPADFYDDEPTAEEVELEKLRRANIELIEQKVKAEIQLEILRNVIKHQQVIVAESQAIVSYLLTMGQPESNSQ